MSGSEPPDVLVAVIGAGPGGIATGVLLKKAAITDFILIDRADGIGGSWHENTYPGVGVDIPAIAYQYSFARNPNWNRVFALGAEVKAYHEAVVDRFGIRPHLRLNTEIVCEEWDDRHHLWRLHTADDTVITARFLISAVGGFVAPKADCGIPGLDTFEGKVQRPTSWDHSYDHTDKRVGIVGTGASAVQITPAIAAEVGTLTVFQRTPVWCLPKLDFEVPGWLKQTLKVPGVQAAVHGGALVGVDLGLRLSTSAPVSVVKPSLRTLDGTSKFVYRQWLKGVVRDKRTREGLTPDHGPAAKRPTMSNTYLRAFNRENVDLVTEPIDRFTETGIRTRDGRQHKLDMVVLATGYELFSDPETYRPGAVLGRDGFDLGTFFAQNGLQAYQSVALPKLPNRWMLVGPYSWTGSGWHAFVEMTAHHAVRAIGEARNRGATSVEVRQDAHDTFHADVYRRAEPLRYYYNVLNGHARTYYRNSQGDVVFARPSGFFQARNALKKSPLDDYLFETLPAKTVRPKPITAPPQRQETR